MEKMEKYEKVEKYEKKENECRSCGFSRLLLENRNHLEISGAEEVLSYDENGLSLIVAGCGLTIEGEGIRVSVLDVETGNVTADGHFTAVLYEEEKKRKPGLRAFLRRRRGGEAL